jgi:ATP-binding cassette subfamily B multidrug efflux pump
MESPTMPKEENRQPVMSIRPGGHHGPGNPSRIEKPKDVRRAALRLLEYFKPYAKELILIFLFIIIYTLLSLAGPYLMGRAIDEAIYPGGDVTILARLVLFMLIAYIGGIVFQALSAYITAKVSQLALRELRQKLFEHLQTLSLSFFDRNPAGELMSRLTNDIDAINTAVSQNITSIFANFLSMVGIVVMMFVLNHWLALVSLFVVPIMFAFTGFIARYTRKGYRELQLQLGNLNATMEENISGQKVVNAYRRNDSVMKAFNVDNQAVYKAGVYAQSYALLIMPLTGVLGNFFIVVLAGVGSWLALKDLVTVGIIATFISYGQQFVQPLRQLGNIYNTIQAALAGGERVFDILDLKPEMEDRTDMLTMPLINGDVEFEHVRFGYHPDVPVIKGMTLHAEVGKTIALVGPTGAGKTTIANLINRFYDIDEGEICIDGLDIRTVQKDSLRRQISLVLQDTFLFSTTIMENIRYGRLDASNDECIQAAKLAEADYFIRQLPKSYESELSERGGNLSQGQRQLLTIARAILSDPGILILDEATSSVDTRTEIRIQKALLRLMEGRTSFVIAHRLSTIRDADQVLVINDGEIIERGTFDELLAQNGFFHHLYMSQFKGHAI